MGTKRHGHPHPYRPRLLPELKLLVERAAAKDCLEPNKWIEAMLWGCAFEGLKHTDRRQHRKHPDTVFTHRPVEVKYDKNGRIVK